MKRVIQNIFAASLILVFLSGCCPKEDNSQAKYIFVMIGDGMGASHVAAAEQYLSWKNGKIGGEQLVFTGFPYTGMCTTYSASHRITDSAASGTAIACGTKTNNGYLGVDTAGAPLTSIAYMLNSQGYKVGIMSSVPVNHATPASFYAHNKARGDYYNISLEIPESGFDFFAGSGFLQFNGKEGDKEYIDAVLEQKGYEVCFGLDEYEQVKEKEHKGIVLVPAGEKRKSAGNYVVEAPKEQTLAEVVETAIDYLGDEEPFFVMCEGGEIDWAAHSNRTMATIEATLRFNDAVQVAYEFYQEHPDETLIIVTADHETGGIALGANSREYHNGLGWELLEEAWEKAGRKDTATNEDNKTINESANIGWTSYNHTGAPVPIYAIGKGAEKFTGRMDNTDIIKKIVTDCQK